MPISPYLNLLKNRINIQQVPFSDRGSRLLIFQTPGESKLFIKLAERLITLQPDIEAYLKRPPFIKDLCFIDETGQLLEFQIESYPHVLYFHTRLGDFSLVFGDRRTVAIGLPFGVTAGLSFHVSPQFWQNGERGGVFKSVRNLAYSSNGTIIRNQITPKAGGYGVEFIIQASDDIAITLTVAVQGELKEEPKTLPFSIIQVAAENRWQSWFERLPPVSDNYRRPYAYAWWIMANNLVKSTGAGGLRGHDALQKPLCGVVVMG